MIAAELLATSTLVLGWLLYAAVLLWACIRAPWVELFSDTRRQHLLFGAVLAIFLLWLVRRDFESGLSFHFIGLTAVTLLLDWPLATLAAFVAQMALVVTGHQQLTALGLNGVLLVLIPVTVTEICALAVERTQPRNLFVYIFFSGFFAAGLAALFCILAGLGVLLLDGRYPMPPWLNDFAGYIWLVMFPEAFINGTVVSALVVFYPDWMETFNRTRYLQAPWKDDGDKQA
ncbi:energy-coupling factor ABC transporter permease [Pseudomonas knackmussii]|uniref:Energy-coupling factor ABC transporter permease n=1 Tax=Pseudomonas knackmussii TaxID=65741 RepID=A0ABY4KQP9_9PSED|nr:energy-coupling factor ABC transporter permease [Pseudomonas knackmussii]UPQ81983.1 energy-coupling factor ABC transporter permease [Pseudomonas knackmussii]